MSEIVTHTAIRLSKVILCTDTYTGKPVMAIFMNVYLGLYLGQLDEENLFEEISDIDLIL